MSGRYQDNDSHNFFQQPGDEGSGGHGRSRIYRKDQPSQVKHVEYDEQNSMMFDDVLKSVALNHAINGASQYLLDLQAADGHWCAELEGDSILESEYILLLAYLGQGQSEKALKAARYLLSIQNSDGGWSMYPGGPSEVSATVKGYLALKITGHAPETEPMQRALVAARCAGGVEAVNSFTRYYLALLGLIPYAKCPAVPPELILIPKWFPISIYSMSAWSRTIVVPLSLLWSFQPKTTLPEDCRIDELFLNPPRELSLKSSSMDVVESHSNSSWMPWKSFFRGVDQVIKVFERLKLKPFRSWANKKCEQWILERFEKSDGLGAIFPPIVWSIIGLKCLGHDLESPSVKEAMKQLDDLIIEEDGMIRLQPCKSPVWDTAIAMLALREAGIEAGDDSIRGAVKWLLSKEVRQKGDWSVNRPDVEPAGWYFEYRNEFYPDVDDTIMVLMALAKCLPGVNQSDWSIELLKSRKWMFSTDVTSTQANTILTGSSPSYTAALQEMVDVQPMIDAMRRGLNWIISMQCKDGGWAAFDVDNTCDLLTHVPFADHNAMIDPSTADITARVLEMMGCLGLDAKLPEVQRGLKFVMSHQEKDGSWYGRWGVNYLYGTWQVLVGLREIGVSPEDSRMQDGAKWLLLHQNPDGGWGETAASYDDPMLKGLGPSTASQTSWALMGLMAAGFHAHTAVEKGIQFLMTTQTDEGTWEETEFTGTGFPRVFYLRYHFYRHSFPLMAMGRYRELIENAE